MSLERASYFKQFCKAAGIATGTLRVRFTHGLSIAQFAELASLVAQNTGREPDTWSKEWLVVERIHPVEAASIATEVMVRYTPQERFAKGISVEFEGKDWVGPVRLLICRKPVTGEEEE